MCVLFPCCKLFIVNKWKEFSNYVLVEALNLLFAFRAQQNELVFLAYIFMYIYIKWFKQNENLLTSMIKLRYDSIILKFSFVLVL